MVWGAYHGALLIADRRLSVWMEKAPALLHRGVTFVLVMVGWVFFRSDNFSMAADWLRKLAGLGTGAEGPPAALVLWLALAAVAVNTLPETWDFRFGVKRPWAVVYAPECFWLTCS